MARMRAQRRSVAPMDDDDDDDAIEESSVSAQILALSRYLRLVLVARKVSTEQ